MIIETIASAFSAVKGASDLTQSLLTLKTDAAVSAKIFDISRLLAEVQAKLLATQTDYFSLLRSKEELETEVINLKNWTKEQERYYLHEYTPGTFVYRIKPDMQGLEPIHDLCPKCYQNGVKSILQNAGIRESHHCLQCLQCNAIIRGARHTDEALFERSSGSRRLI